MTDKIKNRSLKDRRKHNYTETILETTMDGFWAVNEEGKIIEVNISYCDMSGYTKEELLTMWISDIEVLDTKEDIKNRIKRIVKNKYELFETQHRKKDGSIIDVEISVTYMETNGHCLIAFCRDITERNKRIKDLQESKERFKALFDNNAAAMALINEDTTIAMVNKEYCKVSGYTEEEVEGISWTTQVIPEDLERLKEYNRNRINDPNNTPINYEFSFYCKDGSIKLILSSVATHNKNIIISFIDITERKRMEEEQKKSEQEKIILENKLLQASKMDAIGTLAGGIAHDFNNLLMGIQGCASLMLMNTEASHYNYYKLKQIEDQIQSGANLTRQLLGFARGGNYDIKPTNMNDLIINSIAMFSRIKKEIHITTHFNNNLHIVEVDQGQIGQIFINLFINAWHAMPLGGEIHVETNNILIDNEKYVRILVSDSGVGMDEKIRIRIFEPFFTTKELGRGTGLGLAVVYGIVKSHKGTINVKSAEGQGTTFEIDLPASDKSVLIKEKTLLESLLKGTETILLTDDERIIAEVTKRLLEHLGYTVYTVGSGQEAIALYMEKRNRIDLIMLDMIMPGISGSDTFDHLRKINPNVKILLSSGYSINGAATLIMDRKCNGFIQKPFRIEELSRKIREILDKK